MEAAKPIVVKKVRKGGHAHHGGAWKVAFADFVTAMMAFFLLMWLMGSTTPEERAAIADYFENPNGVTGPGGASSSMIKQGAVQAEVATNKKSKDTDAAKIKVVERDPAQDQKRLASLKNELEQAISQSEALKDFKDQLLLDITPEGLRIQIVDKENRPMFDIGSSHLKPYTAKILYEIAKIINKVPNKISLTGHTDATPFSSIRGYTNWELSTDRANASRRALVLGGLDESKIAKVVGLSSTVLFDKENPRSPVNRRISMIVMNKQAEDALRNDNAERVQSPSEAAGLIGSPSGGAPVPATVPAKNGNTTSNTIMLPLRNESPSKSVPRRKNQKGGTSTQSNAIAAPIQLPLKKALDH